MPALKKKARARPRKPVRRSPPPRWLKPAVRVGVALGVAALAVAVPTWLVRAGHADAAGAWLEDKGLTVSAGLGLAVREVLVQGRAESEGKDVLAALDVRRGSPIFGFDPHEAQARLEQLPWIRKATVERRLPDTVFVRLEERTPMALWQKDGKLALVDRDGAVIPGADPARFGQLPQIIGEGAPANANAILAITAAEPDLRTRVAAMTFVGGRRWTVIFDNGAEVQLPEQDAGRAWAKFAAMQRSQDVLARDVANIDLRLPDRTVVRLSPGVPPPKAPVVKKTGKDT
ncbi:MAG TPA: cell division protein FtsQ/DivIB [Alphaproteobacteria bacterium]|jgi:cell division protein FtsQ